MHIKILVLITSFFSPNMLAANISNSVIHFGAIPNDGIDDSVAFNLALSSLSDNSNITIPPGEYDICNTLFISDSVNIALLGSKGAILKKCPNFNGEYLLYVKRTEKLNISNLHFIGLFNGGDTPQWGKQGIYLASTTNSMIANNTFDNFGDAALRITTSPNNNVTESRNATIINNQFSNCTQVTTTQSQSYGDVNVASTHNITFSSNTFDNCTLKLCARKATEEATIFNNHFKNNKGTALESCYYSNLSISHNQFELNSGFAINIYPNTRAPYPVKWGDIKIADNTFDNSTLGIRLQSFSSSEVADIAIQNLSITNNVFLNISCTGVENKYKQLIRTYSQHPTLSFENITINKNKFTINQGCDFLSLDAKDSHISIEDNKSMPRVLKKIKP